MATESAYLKYLPPVLWQDEAVDPDFSLGAWLRIFEKLLSGIDDGVAIRHDDHEHSAIEQVIARIPRLFDPWTTPREFLDWLASWVALELEPQWSEYQARQIVSRIVELYAKRGTRDGFFAFLALYLIGKSQPRIVLDEGSRLLFSPLGHAGVAPVHPLVSQSHAGLTVGIKGPISIATGPDGTLFIVDFVFLGLLAGQQVFRLSRAGEYLDWDPLAPKAMAPPVGDPKPAAVAVDSGSPYAAWITCGARPNAINVVLPPNATGLYKVSSPAFASWQPVDTVATLGTVAIVATVFDPKAPNHLLILDRGVVSFDNAGFHPAQPVVIDVELDLAAPAVKSVTKHPLANVVEPLAMIADADGSLLICDGGDQNGSNPGALVRVARPSYAATVLTQGMSAPANPLVTPVGIVQEDASHFLVLDSGLRPFSMFLDFLSLQHDPTYNPFLHKVAEAPTIYRVDVSGQPTFTRATEDDQLVNPTALAATHGNLYIGDIGLGAALLMQLVGMDFGIRFLDNTQIATAIHFSEQRPTTIDDRKATLASVARLLEREKPAHVTTAFVSRAASVSQDTGWQSLGNGNVYDPIVGRNADGRLEVFAEGINDRAIWHIWQTAPGGPWSNWESLGGGPIPGHVGNVPVVANNADGRLELFVIGPDDTLWHRGQSAVNGGPNQNSWNAWASIGGNLSTDSQGSAYFAVANNQDGRLEVFAHGADDALHHVWQISPNGPWSGWSSRGGTLSKHHGHVTAVLNQNGRLQVFVQWADDTIHHISQTAPNNGWGAFADLGTWLNINTIGTNIAAAQDRNGAIELLARGDDNALYRNRQFTAGNTLWIGWTKLGSVLSGGTNSRIALVTNTDGLLEAFMQGDREIHHIKQMNDLTWGTFEPLGGTPMVGVVAAVNLDGRLEAFIRSPGNLILHRWQTAAGNGWVTG